MEFLEETVVTVNLTVIDFKGDNDLMETIAGIIEHNHDIPTLFFLENWRDEKLKGMISNITSGYLSEDPKLIYD